jgi:hypothetical protein
MESALRASMARGLDRIGRMSVHELLAVPYHQQDTDVYCGAACAQMVVASMGAGLQGQDGLYTDARNHTSELASWYNPPDGLLWLMNDRRPAGFGGWFVLYSLGGEDALSRKLCWTIHHYQVAPIALVYGGDHWLVVRGFTASAAPASYDDTAYTITGFDLNNPWPPAPSFYAPPTPPPAPPPHSATDGCGSGGTRGTANEHIAYSKWQSSYATANKYGTLWNGRFVAVCDPDPPPTRPGAQAPGAKKRGGERLLTPKAAVQHALTGLKRHGLTEREDWTPALSDTKPATPALVQRLDQIDSFYYIVPFERPGDGVTAAVAVDARFGDYEQALAVPAEGGRLLEALDRKAVLERVVGQTLDLGGRTGRVTVRPEAYSLYPTLVWRPARESLSPFVPFHMFTVGARRIYVRIDGRVFGWLNTFNPGI